ncbi:glycerophosphodiester phosphodiesterase family protein [Jatrophihabitans telluris]|uniref:glycerophosphodiester phosphodiesterase family protein n=1 Tax=Jatrophihabitans telluris TaxID=2038343 RepID=UPI003D31CAB2
MTRHRKRDPLPPNAKPLIIAHRGASSTVAEHTLPAYLDAIEQGADGLECDVRLTRDGHLVCVHDRTVNRTSNGSGVVSELDLAGLRELDFASWKDVQDERARRGLPRLTAPDLAGAGAVPEQHAASDYLEGVAPDRLDVDGNRVLTLELLLSVVVDAGRPLRLLIETKHPTRYGGMVEKELVRMLHRFGWQNGGRPGRARVRVMSFAPLALRRIRLLDPGLKTVLLLDRSSPIRRDGSLPSGVRIAGPGVRLLHGDPGYVERAHAQGNRVFCWTVDEPADVSLVAGLGVDAIITNRPTDVRAQLGRD